MVNGKPVAVEIERLEGSVARARNDLALGGVIDVSPLEKKVQALCAQIQALPVEQGRALMPRLTALLDELEAFAREVEAGRHALARELGQSDKRQSATSAYIANSTAKGR